jgi:hypothetical protein
MITAAIGGRQAYVYQCTEHPECNYPIFHVIDPIQLEEQAQSGDPEYYFVASHIPEVWEKEWDWDNPIIIEGKNP